MAPFSFCGVKDAAEMYMERYTLAIESSLSIALGMSHAQGLFRAAPLAPGLFRVASLHKSELLLDCRDLQSDSEVVAMAKHIRERR